MATFRQLPEQWPTEPAAGWEERCLNQRREVCGPRPLRSGTMVCRSLPSVLMLSRLRTKTSMLRLPIGRDSAT